MNVDSIVSYDAAKDLRNVMHYDRETQYYYDTDGILLDSGTYHNWNGNEEEYSNNLVRGVYSVVEEPISAPTLYDAQRYLREKYHLYIDIITIPTINQKLDIYNTAIFLGRIYDPLKNESKYTTRGYCYEDVLSAAIECAINLYIDTIK